MNRIVLASIAVSMLVAASPVSAQSTSTMTCKEQMAKGDSMMNSETDATKKAAAMKEMMMAKEMMAKNDEKGCMMHMQTFMHSTDSK